MKVTKETSKQSINETNHNFMTFAHKHTENAFPAKKRTKRHQIKQNKCRTIIDLKYSWFQANTLTGKKEEKEIVIFVRLVIVIVLKPPDFEWHN